MNPGQVLRFTNIEDRPELGLRLGYKAKRTEQYVAVLLGIEARDGTDDLDVVAAMNQIGWVIEEQNDE